MHPRSWGPLSAENDYSSPPTRPTQVPYCQIFPGQCFAPTVGRGDGNDAELQGRPTYFFLAAAFAGGFWLLKRPFFGFTLPLLRSSSKTCIVPPALVIFSAACLVNLPAT